MQMGTIRKLFAEQQGRTIIGFQYNANAKIDWRRFASPVKGRDVRVDSPALVQCGGLQADTKERRQNRDGMAL
jgi:hypothetical protein